MPDALSGRATFPAVSTYTTCEYECSHGTAPGTVTITLPVGPDAQLQLDKVADLDLSDGQLSFKLRDCRVVSAARLRSGTGLMCRVTLHDRRWAWKFTVLSGAYNARDASGRIVPSSRTRVKRLAELCLEAMGEADGSWDISKMPDPEEDEALPAVNWDLADASQALAELADKVGCRVIFQPVADRVVVAPPGDGADLPDGDYEERTASKAVPAKPGELRLYGAQALFTAALVLEAVGEDLDGRVVPIEELSYAPRGGWCGQNPAANAILSKRFRDAGRTIRDVRAIAKKTVFKWYRVTIRPARGDAFAIPGLDQFDQEDGGPAEVVSEEQLMPLDRVVGADRDEDKHLYTDPAFVRGAYWSVGAPFNTPLDARVSHPFAVDTDRGLVMFDRPTFRMNLNGVPLRSLFPNAIGAAIAAGQIQPKSNGPADLVLVCSLMVRDRKTRQPIRYVRKRKIQGGRAGAVEVVRRDDVQFAQYVAFDPETVKELFRRDNRDDADKAADKYLDAVAVKFDDRLAETKKYPRLVPIDPDGAIQQVSWECSGRVSTTVSRNTEHVPWLQPYAFRQAQERTRYLYHQLQFWAGAGFLGPAARWIAAQKGFDVLPPPG